MSKLKFPTENEQALANAIVDQDNDMAELRHRIAKLEMAPFKGAVWPSINPGQGYSVPSPEGLHLRASALAIRSMWDKGDWVAVDAKYRAPFTAKIVKIFDGNIILRNRTACAMMPHPSAFT